MQEKKQRRGGQKREGGGRQRLIKTQRERLTTEITE